MRLSRHHSISEKREHHHIGQSGKGLSSLAEIQALRDNDTFELVDPPPGVNIIGTMIAFRVKEDENGSIERLKARICAQGFTQEFLKD